MKKGNWTIEYNPKPIPDRRWDWDTVHDEYDGEDDDRYFCVDSVESAKKRIDEYEAGET